MLGSADFDIIILSTDRYSVYQLLRFRHSCLRSVFFYFYFLLERGRLYCIEVHNIPRYHFQDFSSFSASMTKPPFPPFPNHSAGSICQRGGIRTFVAKSKPTRVETYIFFFTERHRNYFVQPAPPDSPEIATSQPRLLQLQRCLCTSPHISHTILLISCHGNKKPRQHKTSQRNAAKSNEKKKRRK